MHIISTACCRVNSRNLDKRAGRTLWLTLSVKAQQLCQSSLFKSSLNLSVPQAAAEKHHHLLIV